MPRVNPELTTFSHSRLLLVIAHPDDEVMFFSPLLLSKRDSASDIYIICLSTGDFESMGTVRCKELYKSCGIYGIPEENVRIVNHELLQDGMKQAWPPQLIADIVNAYAIECRPTIIATFDEMGVSGHPNHIAVYKGVSLILSSASLAPFLPEILLMKLESTNVARKFMGVLDVFLTSVIGGSYKVYNLNFFIVLLAMWKHRSQFLCYRFFFILFSRFTYMNSFRYIGHTQEEGIDLVADFNVGAIRVKET